MHKTPIDLTNCDTEPIHIPGQIQSHGFLIVIDQNLNITYHSENVHAFLKGIPDVLLGISIRDIESIIGQNEPPDFINQLISFGKINGFDQTNPFHTDIQGESYNLIISRSGSAYLLEFEPVLSDLKTDIQKMIGRSIAEMLADKDITTLLNNTTYQVKTVIGYDRVMVYRFASDGHGEVVAEAKNENLESWLGLHYPASDIPKQARELYKLNLTRLIANVFTTPSKILSTRQFAEQPLDLTNSQLRAVSPMHIEYLKNMGVHSSFSISLIYKGELWGLIACHNYSPRFIDYKARDSAKLIGQILSSALEFRQDEANKYLLSKLNANVDALSKLMLKDNSIEEALTEQYVTLLDAVEATGALLAYENNITKLGKTPDDKQIAQLIEWVGNNVSETFYYTNELPEIYSESVAYKHIASGIMVITLSRELAEYIIWFKPEHIETITWAGNPDKPFELNSDGSMILSPRRSFEAWSQQVAGKSQEWQDEEIKSAMRLKAEVTYAINQKAGAIRMLNERLKQAYEELDTFSFTISHDLKNPLSTIKGYAQLLTRDASLQPRVKDTLVRINDKVDKMNLMINEVLEYSRIGRQDIKPVEVDLGTIIADQIKDLKIAFNTDNLKVVLGNTPVAYGDPVMLSQVFANLLSNAIKYSMEQPQPTIHVEGKEDELEITYSIKDNGVGIEIKQLPRIFELFKRMDNVQHIEGSGVGLAIVKRIVEKHNGKIWVDSQLGKGSTFFVSFKKGV
ncbi:ATP-binding protein [Mucilaginibacter auburnensis]|uniref:histidine kinase n=1 Tax=Mucilaginibacter auburnensis TaxID=1457233 RepID=A0A2H9VMW9_9SPHI|nr:ATP-binding protein [Mucilaginibacter auburnensis]PJJ79670.1 light-regulated signal transduction histidine kinase (bacteriophytochrome) [Mucilaginibacter auburnensis]